mmetsp:Transcript_12325/g.23393  ORF Transcript_12325/g.23393 Transcript_12325/m.23393 type:complete len:304 (+) Transcript_12325:370-1281(+)
MGCTSSRTKLSAEETYLTTHEAELHYGDQHATQVDLVFRKYSYQSHVNPSQLQNAASKLNLRITNYSTFNLIEPFYNGLKQEGSIHLLHLLLLGLFLAKGSVEEKARLLFEVYDDLNTEEVQAPVIKKILSDLYDIAVNRLPKLVAEPHHADAGNLRQYLAKIAHVKELAIEKAYKGIVGTGATVKKVAFVTSFSSDSFKALLSTTGFRGYFFSEFSLSSADVKAKFDQAWLVAHPLPSKPEAKTADAKAHDKKTDVPEEKVAAHDSHKKKSHAEAPAETSAASTTEAKHEEAKKEEGAKKAA